MKQKMKKGACWAENVFIKLLHSLVINTAMDRGKQIFAQVFIEITAITQAQKTQS